MPTSKDTRTPLPAKPGALAKYDYEYERNGTSNLFIFFAPLKALILSDKVPRQIKSLTHIESKAFCRGDRIRTDDLSDPNGALYQAEPHPEQQRIIEVSGRFANRLTRVRRRDYDIIACLLSGRCITG